MVDPRPVIRRQTYRVATINTNMIGTPAKIQLLREMLRAADVDIALLQEVRLHTLPDVYGYTIYSTTGDHGGSGLAIYVRDGLPVTDVSLLPSARGMALTTLGTRIVNVYAPSGTNRRRERSLFYSEEIAPLFIGRYDHCLLGGDFNCVLHPKDQMPHYTPCQELSTVVRDLRLTDTWEQVHGNSPGHTFLTSHSASRLDRIYVSSEL